MKKVYNVYGIVNVEFKLQGIVNIEFKLQGNYGSDWQDINEKGILLRLRNVCDTLEEAEAYLKKMWEENNLNHSEYVIKEVYSFK